MMSKVGGLEEEGEEVEEEGSARPGEHDAFGRPAWLVELTRSMARNNKDPFHRFVQLATIRQVAPGVVKPACRTVVFRGFFGQSEVFKFITDLRSEKVTQVAENFYGEACWYFIKTREQYRISGRLRVISQGETDETLAKARREQWAALSDNARVQFYWPPPGDPKDPRPSAFTPASPPDPLEPPSPFCLVLFFPDQVDHLELRGDPQRRTVHKPVITSPDGTSAEDQGGREACLGFSTGAYQAWTSTSVNP